MIRKFGYLLFLILFFSINVLAQDSNQNALMQKANQSYADKNYKLAVELYEQLVIQNYQAAELNYNLGNAYYKIGEFPKAILNYERAIKLDPNFEDAYHNLKLANKNLQDQVESFSDTSFSTLLSNFVKKMGLNLIGWICIIALLIALVLLAFYFLSLDRKFRQIFFSISIMFMIVSLFFMIFGFYAKNVIENNNQAIIMQRVVTAKSSPDESGTDLFRIYDGFKVQVGEISGEWVEIRLFDSRTGWVRKTCLEII